MITFVLMFLVSTPFSLLAVANDLTGMFNGTIDDYRVNQPRFFYSPHPYKILIDNVRSHEDFPLMHDQM